jgi:hypothetical protein
MLSSRLLLRSIFGIAHNKSSWDCLALIACSELYFFFQGAKRFQNMVPMLRTPRLGRTCAIVSSKQCNGLLQRMVSLCNDQISYQYRDLSRSHSDAPGLLGRSFRCAGSHQLKAAASAAATAAFVVNDGSRPSSRPVSRKPLKPSQAENAQALDGPATFAGLKDLLLGVQR